MTEELLVLLVVTLPRCVSCFRRFEKKHIAFIVKDTVDKEQQPLGMKEIRSFEHIQEIEVVIIPLAEPQNLLISVVCR